VGLTDTFKPDGSAGRRFAPFWWRTWRFAEIRVKTGGQPLTLNAFQTLETHYPFQRRGRFVSNDKELNQVWRIGWDTALLDAHETYQDTSYWEQLQYIGDTRLQMLISYTVSGDPRLPVQALEAVDDSRVVEGIPESAYPSTTKNPIPPFALLWIGHAGRRAVGAGLVCPLSADGRNPAHDAGLAVCRLAPHPVGNESAA
jgi:alpha-L-rhamnosidase